MQSSGLFGPLDRPLWVTGITMVVEIPSMSSLNYLGYMTYAAILNRILLWIILSFLSLADLLPIYTPF